MGKDGLWEGPGSLPLCVPSGNDFFGNRLAALGIQISDVVWPSLGRHNAKGQRAAPHAVSVYEPSWTCGSMC
eukprot:scaffold117202_cov30-Tisochrysis_lutea.AAC.2